MKEAEELETQTQDAGFWDDAEKSQKVLQKIKRLKSKVEKYEKLNIPYILKGVKAMDKIKCEELEKVLRSN